MSTTEEAIASLVQSGKIDEAERLLASALAQAETSELWNDWASIQCSRGLVDQAEQAYRRALRLSGQVRQPTLNLVALLLTQGRLEESIPLLQSLAGRLGEEEKIALQRLADRLQPATRFEIERFVSRQTACGLVLSVPTLQRMKPIHGWMEETEADLLMAAAVRAVYTLPGGAIVEVGSFCGRSTVVLGTVVKDSGTGTKVYAIDPHEGVVRTADNQTKSLGPTRAAFRQNMAANRLSDVVEVIQKCSFEVEWGKPISLLFIDGVHDYPNVSRDFRHFEPWLLPGAYIAFHDYADYYPGVKAFVDELMRTPQYERIHGQASMIVVRLDPATRAGTHGRTPAEEID